MEISDKALADFEKIWRKHNPNTNITKAELLHIAQRLLYVVKLVWKPIPDRKKQLPP